MSRFLVDGMNLIGSRPDGWWRDLDGAVVRLARELAGWLDAGRQAGPSDELTVVFDGGCPAALAAAETGQLEVAFAGRGRAADDEIVRRVGIDPDPGAISVVTSDRPLAARVRAAGAGRVLGAGGFRRLLDSRA